LASPDSIALSTYPLRPHGAPSRLAHALSRAQVVGERGRGIPVSSTVTVTDVTTKAVLFSEPDAKGSGQGNHNQTATTCSGTDAEVPASTFFGEHELELP
jgi:hypothetical protein